MAKKFGKFLLLSALTGAAAYGVYSYLQKKEQPLVYVPEDEADDDFDDFSEDLDEDLNSGKGRSYVSLNLDKAEAFANEAFQKAKEVITDSVHQVKETVKSVADSQVYHSSFTDLTHVDKEDNDNESENADANEAANVEEKPEEGIPKPSETESPTDADDSTEQVEEFFNDDTI